MKKQNNYFIIKKIDSEETLTSKEYERFGYLSLVAGILLSGVATISQNNVNDLSLILPLMSLGVSVPLFCAADEISKKEVQRILMKNFNKKNVKGKNEYRKK